MTFCWTNFNIVPAQGTLKFILNSPYYPVIRERLIYFFNYLADTLNLKTQQFAIAVQSNLLDIYIPGKERIQVFIKYSHHPNTEHPAASFPSLTDSTSDLCLGVTETPAMFSKRTSLSVVDVDFLLNELYPDWILESKNSIPEELHNYIKFNKLEDKSDDIYLTTHNKRYKLKYNSPKRIIKIITGMVYSQRSIHKI